MSTNFSTTMNGTQPSACFNQTAERIGLTFLYCLLFVISLAGNIFIGIIVYKTKTMRRPFNFLIVNMAFSDLLYPIFLFPRIVTKLYVDSWLISGPLGQALCKLAPFLQNVSTVVSIQSLVLIAVDRFGAVVFPLRSPLISSKLCPFFIAATWIVGMAVHSPFIFTRKIVEYSRGLQCETFFNASFKKYFAVLNVVFIYIPLLLIATLHIIIYIKLKSQTIPGEKSVIAGQQRMTRERNVLKMSIAIVLVFAVCWLPVTIHSFVALFSSDNSMISSCGFHYIAFITFLLARAYCAINPCICFIFSENYRQGLKNFLSYFFCKSQT